jgi:hypothetical protein
MQRGADTIRPVETDDLDHAETSAIARAFTAAL